MLDFLAVMIPDQNSRNINKDHIDSYTNNYIRRDTIMAKLISGTRLSLLVLVTLSSFITTNSYAACEGLNCACVPSELQFETTDLVADEDGNFPISLEADDVEAQGDELVT